MRSALELLGSAYALHPGFAEAEIVDGRRRAARLSPTTCPRSSCADSTIHINGMYRHGFLLAPVLAELVADYLATGAMDERVFRVE